MTKIIELSKTNEARATRGRSLLEYHQTKLLEEFNAEIDKDGVASLLADLKHLCNKENIDFGEAANLSEIHFNEEISGGDDWLDNIEDRP